MRKLLQELHRRQVFQAAGLYLAASWIIIEVASVVLPTFDAPDWILRTLVVLAVAGFPVMLVLAWSYELTLKRLLRAVSAGPDDDAPRPAQIRNSSAHAVYRVGRCSIDTGSRQIRFDGATADVQPRVFDLIVYLVRERGRAVSKDELFEKVWPSVVVSESSLTQSVKRARDLFRQHGFETEVIRTVHSRGYRFDAGVIEEESATLPVSSPSRLRPLVVLAATVLVLAGAAALLPGRDIPEMQNAAPNSLVVLPFQDLTGDQSVSYFPEGLTATLSDALTRVNGLRVIGRNSAAAFDDAAMPLEAFANRLNVANVISGSVQKSAEVLRITVNLVRVRDNYVLWSQTYDRELDNVFEVQDDVARSIVERMAVMLSEELTGYQKVTSAQSGEAYRLLLRAQQLQDRRTDASLEAAGELFKESLRIDPAYIPALLGLGTNLYQRATLGAVPREPAFPEAIALFRQVLSLDEQNAAAYVMLAEIQHRYFWDFVAAADSFEEAFVINPGSANTLSAYSRFLSKTGNFERAVETARAAKELDPLSQAANSSLVIRLLRVGDVDAAAAILAEMRSERPDNGDLPWLESLWHLRKGEYQDALRRIAEDDFEHIRLSISAIAQHHLGRIEQARASLNHLIDTDAGAAFQIAEVFAQWGQADDAFTWLERGYSQGDPGLAELRSSAHLEPLYADPRFNTLLTKVGLPILD